MRAVLHKVIRVSAPPRLFDPARGAARLLGWVGLTVLMIGAPLAGVLSRRSLFILLPIGAGLLAAAFTISVSSQGLRTFREALREPIGLAACLLGGWALLSLLWTPFPAEVWPDLVASLATIVLAALIIAHIPERRALKALYLVPGGVAVTALATLGMAVFGPASFRGGSEFDPSLLERSVLTLVVLVWPALGALTLFAHARLAMALAVLVAAALMAAGAPLAMATFVVGTLAFADAVGDPSRAARRTAVLFAGLLVIAPLMPFVLAPLAAAIAPVGRSTVAAMADWRALVAADGLRLATGHGIGTAAQGVIGGWLPPHAPRTMLFESWYELGLVGALSLAGVVGLGLLAAARAAPLSAPALLAGMTATLAIACFGVATAQVWFVTLASLQAVAFGLLCRSSRGGARPSAAEAERLPEATPEPAPESAFARALETLGTPPRPMTKRPATLPHM